MLTAAVAVSACSVYDPALILRDAQRGETARMDAVDASDRVEPADVLPDQDASEDADANAPTDAMDVPDAPDAMDATSRPEAGPEAAVDGGDCPSGQTRCGARCVSLATDVDHCGLCFDSCPRVSDGTRQCVAGRCQPQCTPPASPFDPATCAYGTGSCLTLRPTGLRPNESHVRFGTMRAAGVQGLAFACSPTATGPDDVYAFRTAPAATYSAELYTEGFDAAMALRLGPCMTATATDRCANSFATPAAELVATPSALVAGGTLIASPRSVSGSGPYAMVITPTSACSNRQIDGTESCDDGNLDDGDGCSASCEIMAASAPGCSDMPSRAALMPELGVSRYRVSTSMTGTALRLSCTAPDLPEAVVLLRPAATGQLLIESQSGAVGLFEVGCAGRELACAPSTRAATAAADVTAGALYALVLESSAGTTTTSFALSLSRCGDGVVEGIETCDDGNRVNGDGCTNACRREAPCELNVTLANSATAPARPPTNNCANVGATGIFAASGVVSNHVTSVTLRAGDRVTYDMARSTGGSTLWGLEIAPSAAAPRLVNTASCSAASDRYACVTSASNISRSVTWVSPAGGTYLLRFFTATTSASRFAGQIVVDKHPLNR